MKRIVGCLLVAVVGYTVAALVHAQSPASYPGSDLTCANAVSGDGWNALAAKVGAPSGIALANQEGGNLSTVVRVGQRVCYAPSPTAPTTTTTVPATSTTIAPATSTTTSTTSTTTSTVAPPSSSTQPPTGGPMQLPGIAPARVGPSSNVLLRQSSGFFGDYTGGGEVRITCGTSHTAYDDPIVIPGGVGQSHLHTFIGNAGTNAHSTYESLRNEPLGSTCAGGSVNKSAYWFPSLIDGASNTAVTPTLAFTYYKTGHWGQDGRNVVPVPPGLRMVSGTANTAVPQPQWMVNWLCSANNGGVPGTTYRTSTSIPPCEQGRLLNLSVLFQQCWNGRDLDSADHKSHMAYFSFDSRSCPATHPVLLPEISLEVTFLMGPSGSTDLYLASDMMLPAGSPKGRGLHADFWDAWTPEFQQALVTNCLNARKDCGVRSVGDGYRLLDVN